MKSDMKMKFTILILLIICRCFSVQAQWIESNYGILSSEGKFIVSLGGSILSGSAQGGIYRSADQGASWHQSATGLTDLHITALSSSASYAYAATTSGVFISSDEGQSWQATALSNGNVVTLISDGDMVLSSDYTTLRVSLDKGATWTEATAAQPLSNIRNIVLTGTSLIAINATGIVFSSGDQGLTWTKISTPGFAPTSLTVKGNHLVATTSGGQGVQHSSDAGVSWSRLTFNFSSPWIVKYLGTTLFASVSFTDLVYSTNDGATWTKAILPSLAFVEDLAFDGSRMYAMAGGILRSQDGGINWANAGTGLFGPRLYVLATKGTTLLSGGISGISRSTDNGLTWTPTSFVIGSAGHYVNSIITAGTKFYAAVADEGIYISGDDGITWTISNTGLTDLKVVSLSTLSGIIYAGTNTNGIFKSTNSGSSWTSIGLAGSTISSLFGKGTTLFAAVNLKGIYRSTNGGNSWEALAKSPGIANTILEFKGNIYAASNGGVYMSPDNGTTWSEFAPTVFHNIYIYAMMANENTLYISAGGTESIYGYTGNSLHVIPLVTGAQNTDAIALTFSGNKLVAGIRYSQSGTISTYIPNFADITSVSPAQASVGAEITISATNVDGTLAGNIVKFNDEYAKIIRSSATSLTVIVPSVVGDVTVTLVTNGTSISSINPFHVIPEIKNISPTAGMAGTEITLSGSGFDVQKVILIKFNGNNVQAVPTAKEDTRLKVLVPGAAISGPVTATIDGITIASTATFSLIPQITDFTPTAGTAGALVTIQGKNFSQTLSDNIVKFNGVSAQIVSANVSSIVAKVPGSVSSGLISVSVSGQEIQSKNIFSVLPLPINCSTLPSKPQITELPGPVLVSNSASGNQWYVQGKKITGENSPTLAIKESGVYSLQIILDGCVSEMSDSRAMVITAIADELSTTEVFPNPATNEISIPLTDMEYINAVHIVIYNSQGVAVVAEKTTGIKMKQLVITGLQKGLYLIEKNDGTTRKYSKFIKE